jgi:hypothetical protein
MEKVNLEGQKRVLSEVTCVDTSMFMTSFDEAVQRLMEQKETLEAQGWTDLHLKMECYYESSELKVYGMRLENDEEFEKRKAAEKKKLAAAQKKAERELKKYQELKLKYEGQ